MPKETQRPLREILGGDDDTEDAKSTTKTNQGAEILSEEESRPFIKELEGEDANIDDIKDLDDLLKHPKPGSIILAFQDPKRRTKAHLVKFATDSFLPNLAPIMFSDEVPMEMYVIFRLVLPHKKALAVAEKIGQLAKESKMTTTQVLAEISGLDIKSRGDLKKILMKVINYHPHISSTLGSFFSRMNVKMI